MMISKIEGAVAYLRGKAVPAPKFGIILGTGLGALAGEIADPVSISYEKIPHFPISTVESHTGRLIFGHLGGKPVVAMQGRFHYYEGYSMQEVTFPVRVMKMLGIEQLYISNAAGSLHPDYAVSDLMIIDDHINLMPENPLTGPNHDALGPRFPDMSEPYDLGLVAQGMALGKAAGIRVHQGVYAAVPGPNLETKAEYRYLRTIGADAVGMSTVPENIVARHMGLPCFALSVITDLCTPGNIEKINVEKIIAAAMKAEPGMTKIMRALIENQ